MKFLCILFSMLVIILSVKPCCADKDCGVKADAKTESAADKDKCPGCSPFFACGSCTGFVVGKRMFVVYEIMHQQVEKIYLPYKQPCAHDVALPIWQPPQLS